MKAKEDADAEEAMEAGSKGENYILGGPRGSQGARCTPWTVPGLEPKHCL